MLEGVNKLMLAGLGLLSMTRERAEKLFDEYVHRGEEANADRQGFIKDVMDAAEKSRKELSDMVEKHVDQATAKLNLVTREDLARVEAKLDQLLKHK